jgi:hypothetical protein
MSRRRSPRLYGTYPQSNAAQRYGRVPVKHSEQGFEDGGNVLL